MTALGPAGSLPRRLADALKVRLQADEWPLGQRLPTEAQLVAEYSVSRATVRQAIKDLENQHLVVVRQGSGTYRADHPGISTGMQELASISATIAAMGLTPSMLYRRRIVRTATQDEGEQFALAPGAAVVDIQRKILADGRTVAFSYDVLPRWVFPDDFEAAHLDGSVFGYLAAHGGPRPTRGLAEVHAVRSDTVGWGDDAEDQQLYVLLDQMQYDDQQRPFMHSRSFFLEGSFTFTVLRTR